jgi:hypothetical protein
MAKGARRLAGARAQLGRWATLAYAIGALSVATVLYLLVLQVIETGGADGSLLFMVSTYAVTGALIASRRPANPIGWLFLLSAAFGALGSVSDDYVRRAVVGEESTLGVPALLRSLAGWGWVPLVVPVVAFVPMFFPDGRLLSARWRPMPVLGLIGTIAIAVAIALSPDESSPSLGPNPYAIDAPWVGPLLVVGFTVLISAILLAVASLILRMRRGTKIERQQLKIFFCAALLWPAAIVLQAVLGVQALTAAEPALELLDVLAIVAVPVAVAVAILRYRLYDIDVLIRRTLIYATLSVVLLVAYASAVALIQLALAPVTSGNGLAVAISTLAVLALFQPLRRRIQEAVDRRFYRSRYDAARTLDHFAVRLRDEVDLEAVRTDLLGSVQQTMAPAHVSLWLRGVDEGLPLQRLAGPKRIIVTE